MKKKMMMIFMMFMSHICLFGMDVGDKKSGSITVTGDMLLRRKRRSQRRASMPHVVAAETSIDELGLLMLQNPKSRKEDAYRDVEKTDTGASGAEELALLLQQAKIKK